MANNQTVKTKWNSRGFGSRIQFESFNLLIRLGGRGAACLLLYVVVAWYVLFYANNRKKSGHYIRKRFPEKRGIALCLAIHKHCLEFGKSLVDRAVINRVGNRTTEVEFAQRDELKKLAQNPNGLLLIHAHAGCWQAVMRELLLLDKPVTLLIHRDPNDNNRLFFEQNKGYHQIRIVDPMDGFTSSLEIVAALQKGEVVSVMGDRVFGSPGNTLWENFLGSPAPFPISPYKIAASTQSVCLALFSAKVGRNKYELIVSKIDTAPEKFGQPNEYYRPCLKQFIASMEAFCEAYPFQLFNFFDMWSKPE